MISISGDDHKVGMRLREVRRFVKMTENLSENTFIDCLVPVGESTTGPAPLMGLLCGENEA